MIGAFKSPRPVGGYRIGDGGTYFEISLYKKPSWFHRMIMKWAFGWKWVDADI